MMTIFQTAAHSRRLHSPATQCWWEPPHSPRCHRSGPEFGWRFKVNVYWVKDGQGPCSKYNSRDLGLTDYNPKSFLYRSIILKIRLKQSSESSESHPSHRHPHHLLSPQQCSNCTARGRRKRSAWRPRRRSTQRPRRSLGRGEVN